MADPLKSYLKSIEQALQVGNATEHTHRSTLQALLQELDSMIKVINEPKRIECGAPDLVVIKAAGNFNVGYVETKDVGKSLDEVERSDQGKRYLKALPNLVLTDYLEFRWYVDGQLRGSARAARTSAGGKLTVDKTGSQQVAQLLHDFLAHQAEPVASPQALAIRLARLTHMIRDIIVVAFEQDKASDLLRSWREAFARVLIADIDQPEKVGEFADMLSQTLAYGLFSARVMDTSPGFTRHEAQHLIPKTNPFLRDFFYQVSGPQMDDEPFAGFVADLVTLLANADMNTILAEFGKRTGQEDPVMHFYETFLAAYDPKLRESRGVYYTPMPVVSYIVRSVDYLLKTRFKCPGGLADSSQIEIDNPAPILVGKGSQQPPKKIKVHKVLMLDPATGTATFPYAVIDHIRQQFMASNNAGMWSGYVREHLLPRLFGFELLMAPYAVAHFKLGLQLAGFDLSEAQRKAWAYDFTEHERLGIYLTNTLEGPHQYKDHDLYIQFLAKETAAANRVKRDLPVLVVFGNPPYSNYGRMNRSEWVLRLLDDYKQGLNEKKLNLDDDYIKFIRFGQWRIAQSGGGIVAYITNNSYLDGVTHRRMRESLMHDFTDIFVLDLHGSSRKGETAADGAADVNVFDIQQGVAISLFVKVPGVRGPANVHYAEILGGRQQKYATLLSKSVADTDWCTLDDIDRGSCLGKFFFFKPKAFDNIDEYCAGHRLTDVFVSSQNAIKTDRDGLFYDFDKGVLEDRIKVFYSEMGMSEAFREQYEINNSSSYDLLEKRRKTQYDARNLRLSLYRPFDWRWLYYSPAVTSRPAWDIMRHMIAGENLGLITTRQATDNWDCIVASTLSGHKSCAAYDINTMFPLYAYPSVLGQASMLLTSEWRQDEQGRVPNLNPQFVLDVEARTGLNFTWPEEAEGGFTPEDLFGYIYAVFHSPTYRSRYAEFLKIDFPRVPITTDGALFTQLAALGRQLVALHLLDAEHAPALLHPVTRFPAAGDGLVEKGHPRYDPTTRRVYISAGNVKSGKEGQYFDNVRPEIWAFQVGGYQPVQKWLKDRVARKLTYDDLTHYQRMIVALEETIKLMAEIDAAIGDWPIR